MHGPRFGRPGGWQQADVPDASDATEWFSGRLPDDWFTGPATIETRGARAMVLPASASTGQITLRGSTRLAETVMEVGALSDDDVRACVMSDRLEGRTCQAN